jgi:hypothetical protein
MTVSLHFFLGKMMVKVARSFQSGPPDGDCTNAPAPTPALRGKGPNDVILLRITLTGTVHTFPLGASQFAVDSLWRVNVTPPCVAYARKGWKND